MFRFTVPRLILSALFSAAFIAITPAWSGQLLWQHDTGG